MSSESASKGSEPPIEVVVERLPEGYDPSSDAGPESVPPQGPGRIEELNRAIGPVVAGLLVDLLDAATVSPPLGIVLGWPLGYYIVRQVGCSRATAVRLGALIGVYCALPGTFLVPMATIVVLLAKLGVILRRR